MLEGGREGGREREEVEWEREEEGERAYRLRNICRVP